MRKESHQDEDEEEEKQISTSQKKADVEEEDVADDWENADFDDMANKMAQKDLKNAVQGIPFKRNQEEEEEEEKKQKQSALPKGTKQKVVH